MEKGYLFILVSLPERVEELDVANVPQETLFTTCEAVNDIHPQNGDDTDNANDAENDRNKNDSEHFTVLLSGMKNLCWFPIISAVVTSYDRQGESVFTLSLFRELMVEDNVIHLLHVHGNAKDAVINGVEDDITFFPIDNGVTEISNRVVSHVLAPFWF